MYLWVVIATFITILYSYNLSVRPDMDRAYAETRASVEVAKFRAQHNAVKDYLVSQERAKHNILHPDDPITHVSYFPGDKFSKSTAESEEVASGGTIPQDGVETYLPVGFSLVYDMVSKVICLEEDAVADGESKYNAKQCESGGGLDGSCCTNDGVAIYVVSFKKIPTRWIDKNNETRPKADLLSYIGKSGGHGSKFGYTKINESGQLVLSGGNMVQEYDEDGNSVGAPQYEEQPIFKVIYEDEDFKECKEGKVPCFYAVQRIYG